MENIIANRVRQVPLTKTQQKIADYFIRNPERVGMCSSMEVAKELVSRYASKYGEADMTELVLLAIHIQTAQEQFEETLKH